MEEDYLSNLSLSFEAVEGDYLSTGARALGDYLATLPQAKEEAPLFENCRTFVIRRGDYIDRLVVGKIMVSDTFVWVPGDSSPYRLVEHEGKTVLYLPPIVYKCTRKDAQTLSAIQLKAKMGKETCIRVRADFVKAGLKNEATYKDLDEYIASDMIMIYQRLEELEEAHGLYVLAHVTVEQLSSPTFCPMGIENCAKCRPRGIKVNSQKYDDTKNIKIECEDTKNIKVNFQVSEDIKNIKVDPQEYDDTKKIKVECEDTKDIKVNFQVSEDIKTIKMDPQEYEDVKVDFQTSIKNIKVEPQGFEDSENAKMNSKRSKNTKKRIRYDRFPMINGPPSRRTRSGRISKLPYFLNI